MADPIAWFVAGVIIVLVVQVALFVRIDIAFRREARKFDEIARRRGLR